jgi:hypothetical protein
MMKPNFRPLCEKCNMPEIKPYIFILLAVALLLGACSTVPVTDRNQLQLIPNGQILALSADQYRQVLDSHEPYTEYRLPIGYGGREYPHWQSLKK